MYMHMYIHKIIIRIHTRQKLKVYSQEFRNQAGQCEDCAFGACKYNLPSWVRCIYAYRIRVQTPNPK